MARKGLVQTNLNRERLVKTYEVKRQTLKDIIMSKVTSIEEKFFAQVRLAKMPRNSSRVRVRNRCELTGRSRGYYRRFKMSRICLREMASFGLLPGVKKSSW